MVHEYWKVDGNIIKQTRLDNGILVDSKELSIEEAPKKFVESDEDYWRVVEMTEESEIAAFSNFESNLNRTENRIDNLINKVNKLINKDEGGIEKMREEFDEISSVPKQTTEDKVTEILDAMKDLLIYKNKKYGDSALSPKNVFYKGDATNSICIRLDDKLGRIKNNPDKEIRKNDVCDIIGYCTLLLASIGTTKEDIDSLKD